MGSTTRGLAVLLTALLLAACAAPASDRITVRLGDEDWTVLRATPEGMRHRPGFDSADGMLFDFEREVEPGGVVFVMDDVAMPLDIAWFSAAGALVGTASMAICEGPPCPTYAAPARFRWAIEAPPGAFRDVTSTDRLVIGDAAATQDSSESSSGASSSRT
jgi:uncharacterized membrane protein (UPF0127 family)